MAGFYILLLHRDRGRSNDSGMTIVVILNKSQKSKVAYQSDSLLVF